MNEKVLLDAQREFSRMMPDLLGFAHYRFSFLNGDAREEAVQETLAFAWMNYLSARSKGKQLNASTIIHYASLNVQDRRKAAGSSSTDVMSEQTQLRGRTTVEYFGKPPRETEDTGEDVEQTGAWGAVHDAMVGKRQWERPLERLRLKLDYKAFLKQGGTTEDEKDVFRMLSEGSSTSEMAHKIGVSSPRICQLKNSLGRKLKDFFGPGIRSPLMKRPLLKSSAA